MKEIIINANPYEKRVALVENQLLTEIYIERRRSERINGNIYKGKVSRVLPGMQAAFIDIGLERDTFLYIVDLDHDFDKRFQVGDNVDNDIEEAEVEVKHPNIEELLQEGQEILVQVSKEPLGSKGARVTTNITLPGRYLVYMPLVDHIGISRRIEDPDEKERLKELISKLKPENVGYIVRTVGEGRGEREFSLDMDYLNSVWDNISRKKATCSAPSILHKELDIVLKSIRDIFSPDIDRLLIDSEEEYERCIEFVEALMPNLVDRVKLFTKSSPIFEEFNIEKQIEEALSNKVWLKSGGYIVIDETEALVTIDVNTGRFIGGPSLEDTIYKINMETIPEIVRQIRLRDLGGIIIIDFIDMTNEDNKIELIKSLEEEFRKDRMRTNVLQLTDLGLIEMTRKRVKQSLNQILTSPCPYCGGNGRVKSILTVCRAIQREIDNIGNSPQGNEILIKANPEVAAFLSKQEYDLLEYLEKKYTKQITIRRDQDLHYEDYSVDLL
ncbi:MAG: Rne/Rng family ribonuclease [bacterium]